MVMSSKFMPGIIALVAVGVVQLATALPQIKRYYDNNGDNGLTVGGDIAACDAVAAALNSLKYGSSSISGIRCYNGQGRVYDDLYVSGASATQASANCEAVATALNSLKYGSSSISGIRCRDNYGDYVLYTNEPNDVELLNTLLALNEKGYLSNEKFQDANLAEFVKGYTNSIDVTTMGTVLTTAADLADVKSGMATAADLADVKSQLADLKALLTPECTANRLARAQGNSATNPGNSANDPANSANDPANSDEKTNIAAIVVPIVAVLLVAAIVATVLVMKGRGTNAFNEIERREANVPPATTQPNPAFNPADAADAVPEPGSDEARSTA